MTLEIRTLARQRVPLDVGIVAPFVAVWVVGLGQGLPLNMPTGHDLLFVFRHYLKPLVFAAGLQAVLYLWKRESRYLIALRLLPFLLASVLIHFQFKAWVGLAPRFYDPLLMSSDRALAPVVELFARIRNAIVPYFGTGSDIAYHATFVLMFYISILLHSLLDDSRGQRRLIIGAGLILLLGGVTYWLLPSVGPFLYRGAGNPFADGLQRGMLEGLAQLRATGSVPRGYFSAPLAAMPSLHIAHALFLTLCALGARRLFWLAGIYLPILLFLVVEASASGWHYLVDLPAGALLAGAVFLALGQGRTLDHGEFKPERRDEMLHPPGTSRRRGVTRRCRPSLTV